MLNKELMLFTKAEKEPHIYMTVGQYRYTDESISGYYPELDIGAISKIPVWETLAGALSMWALFEKYDSVHGTYNTFIQSKDIIKDEVRLNITIQGETFQGIYIVGMSTNSVPGDPFKLHTLVNKTVPVIFDPPPTIIWIPLRANLSRRLLRRRSILGGSRC